jgi:hypothetical protein
MIIPSYPYLKEYRIVQHFAFSNDWESLIDVSFNLYHV